MSKIIMTVEEITEAGAWDRFTEMRGMNPWCKKDGQVRDDEEFTLTIAEAKKLGLLDEWSSWPGTTSPRG